MKIENLGVFEPYKPKELPEGYPANVLWCRRVSDGADWYSLVHGEEPKLAPKKDVLYATAYRRDDGRHDVQAVVSEPDMLFPSDAVLLRITGYKGENAQDEIGRGHAVYDAGLGTIEAIDRGW